MCWCVSVLVFIRGALWCYLNRSKQYGVGGAAGRYYFSVFICNKHCDNLTNYSIRSVIRQQFRKNRASSAFTSSVLFFICVCHVVDVFRCVSMCNVHVWVRIVFTIFAMSVQFLCISRQFLRFDCNPFEHIIHSVNAHYSHLFSTKAVLGVAHTFLKWFMVTTFIRYSSTSLHYIVLCASM